MKKKIGLVIIVFIVCWGVLFAIDYSRITNNKKTIFSTEMAVYKDGGSTEYLGLDIRLLNMLILQRMLK